MISISGKKSSPRLAVLRQDGGSITRPARFVGRFCVLFSALRDDVATTSSSASSGGSSFPSSST